MMDIIKIILVVLFAAFAAVISIFLLLAFATGEFINDIYDDDSYWGGKE